MDTVGAAEQVGRPRVGPAPPAPVPSARQLHRWTDLAFLHWDHEPAAVQAVLPNGLTVDTYDGRAWVGLVPFRLHIRAPGLPVIPWAGRFAETNVRTYVRDEHGTRGIWFLSLDAARLGAVAVARPAWSLPYMWSRMRLTHADDTVTYECRRRWPGPPVSSRVRLRLGPAYAARDLDDLDHFLTARWVLFSPCGTGLASTPASHVAWPLRRATVLECDDNLLVAAGLPPSPEPPRALYSDGVSVRLGRRDAVAGLP